MPYGPRYQIPYVLLLIVVCGSLTFANAQNAVVSGAVTAITEVSTPLVGAEINFNDDRDEPILTKTDDNGKYRVSLNPNRNYTVEVRTRGFCSVHRPTFRPISGQSLTFDLSLAVCTSSDPVEVDVSGDREMYQEETLGGNGGASPLIIGFGRRHVEGGIITYQSLNLRGGQLPVTISFDMTTITANVASHELTTSIIKLTGSVSWFGGSGPARTLSCMTLTFGNNYTVWPCDVAEPKDKSGGQETVKKSNR